MLEKILAFAGVSLIVLTYIFEKMKPEISGKGMILLGALKIIAGVLILIALFLMYT